MKYDLYIFDLDGTICDSFEAIKLSLSHMMKELNFEIPSDDVFRSVVGPPFAYSMKHIFNIDDSYFDTAMDIYRKYFNTEGFKHIRIYEGIRQCIISMKQSGAKVALATSKPIGPTMKLLEYFRLNKYFDSINAPEDDKVKNSKEEAIASALKLDHEKAVMIGDRVYDANGAKYHGIDFVAVAYGFAQEGELAATNAKFIASTPMDLLHYFEIKPTVAKFISIEGMDGCGKTTQVNLLKENLYKFGFLTAFTREPGGTKISEKIREILLDNDNKEMSNITEVLLYAASRSQNVSEFILPNIYKGISVICDRYIDSSIAYQGAGRNVGPKDVLDVNIFATKNTIPDKTIYLKMNEVDSLSRRSKSSKLDRLESESTDFFTRTRKCYDNLVNEDKERFIVIDANDTIQNLAKKIFISVAEILDHNDTWEDFNE